MKTKTIGLDIGSTSIRLVHLVREGNAFALDAIASIPQTTKGLASESLIDLQALSDSIKKLFDSANVRNKDVVLSIPESMVYTKIIQMPQLSDQELAAALKFEMEQYIPLPIDQVKTDWEVLSKNDATGRRTMDVMIVAAPIGLLQKYEKVMEMSGLTPDVIETEIVSAHRSLLPLVNSPDANMIVHIGATTTSLAVVKAGKIKMIFSIGLGGFAMTRSISVDLGIDMDQAENYKKAYGLSESAFEGKIGRALSPVLTSIAGDIKKAILLYREKNDNENINQLVLSGGSALLPGMDVYLTNALSAQVVLGRAWVAYNIANVPQELQVQAPSFNVAVGLALRNLI